ncbi:2-hydroxyacid dehydrogenase [Pelagibacterium sp. H642]|uniref:2-hydroxyacid dehydrogenase n=1 Tax=Pelagibacterium sp. H642 TaxID=1881069 RepID=UPI0028157268|nr:2-hydroxyacid dehydrogenase [Pelagibacterium sp. H642]WMT91574.1 2-hydroxyacid dehydrogenase [Pelagibacterium sp. H642]
MIEPILAFDTLIEPIGSDLAGRYRLISAQDASAETMLTGFRAVLTNGALGVDRSWIERMPNLELIAVNGVGTDRIDLDLCAQRKIHVATTLGILTDDVADMAIGLMLAVLRDMGRGRDLVRSGEWARGGKLALSRSASGKKVGIVGLGAIGRAIAERAAAFKMEIGFWNRSEKSVPQWRAFPSPLELARWADVLIVAVAATASTEGLVDRAVIEALGNEGYLVNIARGSVIDENALIEALEARAIAGAGLDVFLGEPRIDERFLKLDNVFSVPHVGSATVETRTAMAELVRENIDAYFAGRQPPTSVTASRFT